MKLKVYVFALNALKVKWTSAGIPKALKRKPAGNKLGTYQVDDGTKTHEIQSYPKAIYFQRQDTL